MKNKLGRPETLLLAELRQQVGPQLQPEFRAKDFAEFEVGRAFRLVADMVAQTS